MKKWVANRVAGFVGRHGYVITRARFHEENAIDLRGLLAHPIEQRKERFDVLQIGANDGVVNDPIHHLVKTRGWNLYAVEPVQGPFEKLRANYRDVPNVQCIQRAIGPVDGETTLYTLEPQDGAGGGTDDHLASFSREVLEKHWRRVPNLKSRIKQVTVPSVTLPSLLREFGLNDIDMLQIDTEGYDYEVIKMAFASGIFPSILAFEWEHLGKAAMWSCRTDLIRHGYRWLVVKGDVVAARDVTVPGC